MGSRGESGHGKGEPVDNIRRALARLRREESAQGATEYAIITVLVVGAVAVITLGITGALNTAFSVVTNAITNAV